jgi:hypothetical protein
LDDAAGLGGMHDNSLGAEGWATHWAPKTAIQTTKCTKHTKNERLAERTLFTHSAGTSIPQNLCCFVYLALCGAPHNADYVEFVRVNAGLPQYSFVGLQTHSFPLSPILGSVWLFGSNHRAAIVRQAAVSALRGAVEALPFDAAPMAGRTVTHRGRTGTPIPCVRWRAAGGGFRASRLVSRLVLLYWRGGA